MHFGDVVFAVSGALTAARHRMDVLGIILTGAVTAIGGTLRDVLLGHPVSWVQSPNELILCFTAAMAAYLVLRVHVLCQGAAVWADALGLAAFAVNGAHIALKGDGPIIIAARLSAGGDHAMTGHSTTPCPLQSEIKMIEKDTIVVLTNRIGIDQI